MSEKQEQRAPVIEEMVRLQEKARYILQTFPGESVLVTSVIQRAAERLYNVRFRRAASSDERTAVLDLDFPFATDDIESVVHRYAVRGDRELFLSIGPGSHDYPTEQAESKRSGTKRAFIVSDPAFGIAPLQANLDALELPSHSYGITSDQLHDLPEESYLYRALDYSTLPDDSIDTLQIVNVLSDPNVLGLDATHLVRILKPETGELVIVTTNTPENFTLDDLRRITRYLGCSIEVFYEAGTDGDAVPQDKLRELKVRYHVGPSPMRPGSYIAILRKPVHSPGET